MPGYSTVLFMESFVTQIWKYTYMSVKSILNFYTQTHVRGGRITHQIRNTISRDVDAVQMGNC